MSKQTKKKLSENKGQSFIEYAKITQSMCPIRKVINGKGCNAHAGLVVIITAPTHIAIDANHLYLLFILFLS